MKRSPLPPRTTQLKRSAKPRAKRKTPRRGRILDSKYLEWCSSRPCCVTGEWPATTHHVREYGSPKDDTQVIRLIAELHLHEAGMQSIERLSKKLFEKTHGISINREIAKLRGEYALYLKQKEVV